MDVVLLLVAIAGIALIAVSRLQARRAGAGRPSAARRRRATRTRARKAVRMTATSPPAATWTPGRAAAPTSSEDEVWDDDLGWEGGDDSHLAPPAASSPLRSGLASPAASPGGRDSRSGREQATEALPARPIVVSAPAPEPAGHVWTTAAAAPAPAAPRRRRSLRGIHPVLLVALYAAVG